MNPGLAALLTTLVVLGGCQTLPLEPDGLSFAERRDRLEAMPSWQIRGRIAIDTGEDAYQGRFNWWQDRDSLSLLIRGPFGAGSVEIAGTVDELTVRARGDTWVLNDAETELSALLGWWVPVASLKDWLLGYPDANYDARTVMAGTVLGGLEQRAWRLDYSEYQNAHGVLVPRRIDLRYESLRLVVTIDDWTYPEDTEERLN